MPVLRQAFKQQNITGGTNTSIVLTYSSAVAVGSLLIAEFDFNTDQPLANVGVVSLSATGTVGGWTQRARFTTPGTTGGLVKEVWWAIAGSATTTFSGVINTPPTNTYGLISGAEWTGVNTATPFDMNGSLPAHTIVTGIGNANHNVTGVSTTNAHSTLIASLNAQGTVVSFTADSGYTLIEHDTFGATGESAGSEYKALTATLSNQTINVFSGQSIDEYIAYVDALMPGASPIFVQAFKQQENSVGTGIGFNIVYGAAVAPGDFLMVIADFNSSNAASAVGIASISSTGTVSGWTRRSRRTLSGAPTAGFVKEVWWAIAASAVTTFSAVINAPSFCAAEISGSEWANVNTSTPFDTNGSLPAYGDSLGTGHTVHNVTGISTNNAGAVLIGSLNAQGSSHSLTADSGWTLIEDDSFGASGQMAASEYELQTATLSSATINLFSGQSVDTYIAMVDAIIGVSTPATGVIGYFTPTEATDSMSAAGYPAIFGSMNQKEAPDIMSAFGYPPIRGTFTPTEASDKMSFTAHTTGVGAAWQSVEGVDRFAASGYPASVGHWTSTESSDLFSARGTESTGTSSKRRRVFFVT